MTRARALVVAGGVLVLAAGGVACGLRARGGGDGAGPLDVEVHVRHRAVAGRDTSLRLDDAALAALRARPEVLSVVPRMPVVAPATGHGVLAGEELSFAVSGFVVGVPAAAVADEPALAARFVEPDGTVGPACRPDEGVRTCPAPQARWYCDALALRCLPRVPVLVSPETVALYDQSYGGRDGRPTAAALGVVAGAVVDGPTFDLVLGEEPLPFARPADGPTTRHTIGAIVVGVSARAQAIGLTVPLGHVVAWNRALVGDEAATVYDHAAVRLRAGSQRAAFTAAVEAQGFVVLDR